MKRAEDSSYKLRSRPTSNKTLESHKFNIIFWSVKMVHRKRGNEKYGFFIGILKFSLPFLLICQRKVLWHVTNVSFFVKLLFLFSPFLPLVKRTRDRTIPFIYLLCFHSIEFLLNSFIREKFRLQKLFMAGYFHLKFHQFYIYESIWNDWNLWIFNINSI